MLEQLTHQDTAHVRWRGRPVLEELEAQAGRERLVVRRQARCLRVEMVTVQQAEAVVGRRVEEVSVGHAPPHAQHEQLFPEKVQAAKFLIQLAEEGTDRIR